MTLFLQFRIGDDDYVLEAAQVVRVLPSSPSNAFPAHPIGVAGAVNYHGQRCL